MTTAEKQQLFPMLIADLIQHAHAQGYGLTFGEAWRSPEEAARDAATGAGIVHSLHTERLAVDFNLFKDGVYLTATADYAPLGMYWEALSCEDWRCCWGGRFSKPDGDHFSIEDGGVQ